MGSFAVRAHVPAGSGRHGLDCRHGLVCRPAQARVAAGLGSFAELACVPARARVPAGWLGFCHAAGRQARPGLVCRPAWARLLTGLMSQTAVECRPARAHVPTGTVRLVCRPAGARLPAAWQGSTCRSSACGHWFVCRYGLVCWPGSCANFVFWPAVPRVLAGTGSCAGQKFPRSLARTGTPVAGRHGLMCRPA